MGSKQEELEATVLLDSYDLVIPETRWDGSRDWSVTNNGLSEGTWDERDRGIALFIKSWIELEESLKKSPEQVKSWWVTIQTEVTKGAFWSVSVTGNQGDTTDEAFLLQLQQASCSRALVLLEEFNHPCTCRKRSCGQSLRFLEHMKDKFLTQEIALQ
ncbi:hypothetical protein DUI87_00744 [Hirundo rustica rustica]|uniref:Uncharacterized protein n=1 Tax=Hirundo rustica rustica TaxID=333673 RepID=A0A3M0LHH6_HIRRU|nr:hypothetical protein DUI87_00744 [Hirundo rustica rustica]